MQEEQTKITCILTLRLDPLSQERFDRLRDTYFPPERNFLKAHLTLFHQLPDRADVFTTLQNLDLPSFDMQVTGLRHLGHGVAYQIDSSVLQDLHAQLSSAFEAYLIPQDRQHFSPHITVQNKVTPEASRRLLEELRESFEPFVIRATGIDLWIYQGGPWKYKLGYPFI